jgi:hypothetical protein
LRSEFPRWCTFLALSGIPSSVASLAIPVTTAATTSTERLPLTLTITAHHSTRRSVRALLLDVGSGNDLGGQVKPFPEVVQSLRGEGIVVVLPRKLGLDETTGCERLAGLDNEEVLRVNVVVLWEVVVLLGDEHTLTEEVLVDLFSVCLGDKPGDGSVLSNYASNGNILTLCWSLWYW